MTVTKGKISLRTFSVCLSAKRTSASVVCITFFGYRRALRRHLKFDRSSSNVVSEKFVLSNLFLRLGRVVQSRVNLTQG